MKRLWQDEVSSHSGRYYELGESRQYPKPIQTPHPPILFGGESDAALRRVADIGQGWIGFNHTPASAAAVIAANVRDDGELVVICESPAWASRLRFAADTLLEAAIAHGAAATRCTVRVSRND